MNSKITVAQREQQIQDCYLAATPDDYYSLAPNGFKACFSTYFSQSKWNSDCTLKPSVGLLGWKSIS